MKATAHLSIRIDEQDVLPTKNYVGTVSVKESMGKTEVIWVADFEMTVEAAWQEVEKGLTNLLTGAISRFGSSRLKGTNNLRRGEI